MTLDSKPSQHSARRAEFHVLAPSVVGPTLRRLASFISEPFRDNNTP